MPRVRSPIGARVVALAALLCLPAAAASAHGGRLPLDLWGGYTGEFLRCQRVIAQAASACAAGAWAARRACREGELVGEPCDHDATTSRVSAVRAAALNAIDAVCGEREAIVLRYLGTFDLQDDVISYCRAWEDAAESAVFGAHVTPSAACSLATAEAVTEVMHQAVRGRRRSMDRLAASPAASPERPVLIAAADRRLAVTIDHATARLTARCPDFAAQYRRPAGELITTLAARADCVGGAFYIQDTVLCPPAVCGNGVIEPLEECDDGNIADGDACPADCAP